jgi:signal transduction histidine kinase
MTSWRSSAAYRIAFVYSAVFALGVLLLGIAIFGSIHVAFTRQLDATIVDEATTLVSEYRSDGSGELADAITQREAIRSRAGVLYAVFSADGRRTDGTLDAVRPSLGLHDITFVDPREGPDTARGYAVDLGSGKRLLVAADSQSIEEIDRTVIADFAMGFGAMIILGFIGALVLGGYLRRRLSAINQGAQGIIEGNISRRMPVSDRHDEFDHLAVTLNKMLERIERLLENLRQVSIDVAHDLRSPLARLRNQLEGSLSAADNPSACKGVVEDAIQRVDGILALFSAILRISEVESGQIRKLFVPVDFTALVTDLAESYAPSFGEDRRDLSWEIAPDLVIMGDRELIAQAIINLLENALVHTPEGTSVSMSLASADNKIILTVSDNGPGVPPEDRDRILERFVRLDSSRTTAGYGLGLNLVAAVAKLHDARLTFSDNSPGLVTTIEFPGP